MKMKSKRKPAPQQRRRRPTKRFNHDDDDDDGIEDESSDSWSEGSDDDSSEESNWSVDSDESHDRRRRPLKKKRRMNAPTHSQATSKVNDATEREDRGDGQVAHPTSTEDTSEVTANGNDDGEIGDFDVGENNNQDMFDSESAASSSSPMGNRDVTASSQVNDATVSAAGVLPSPGESPPNPSGPSLHGNKRVTEDEHEHIPMEDDSDDDHSAMMEPTPRSPSQSPPTFTIPPDDDDADDDTHMAPIDAKSNHSYAASPTPPPASQSRKRGSKAAAEKTVPAPFGTQAEVASAGAVYTRTVGGGRTSLRSLKRPNYTEIEPPDERTMHRYVTKQTIEAGWKRPPKQKYTKGAGGGKKKK